MQSRINHYQNIWDSTAGHPLEKALNLIPECPSKEDQTELEAVYTVLAHRLSIVLLEDTH